LRHHPAQNGRVGNEFIVLGEKTPTSTKRSGVSGR